MRRLVIGNKNYSTWSFRVWWILKHANLDFEEVRIPLYMDGYKEKLLAFAPTGMVPVYQEDELAIWDSLAICEYIAEKHVDLWPLDAKARAHARTLCAEMHSGFFGIRGSLHMNCRASGRTVELSQEVGREIARVESIITQCAKTYGGSGPWLFGRFSIADAMYAPLIFSLATYGVVLSETVVAYAKTIMADRHVQEWFDAAHHEEERITICEVGE